MTMPYDGTKSLDTDALFADLDARGETAAPTEDDIDEDTAGLDEDDEDQDTAAVADLEAEEGDTGDIRALAARGKKILSLAEVAALQRRARARGKRVGRVVEKRKQQIQQKATPKQPLPKNMVPPGEGVRTLVARWSQRNEPYIVNQAGSYYFATEIKCTGEGEGESDRAWLRIPAGTYLFFDRAIDDDISYLGNSAKVTTDVTNFQRPSKNSYHGQDFLIQSITMMEAGLRVKYADSDISAIQNIGNAADMLRGKAWLWDDAGLFLPSEIFHDYSGENLLYRAVRRAGSLYFRWDKRRAGANATSREVLIDHLRNIPDVRVRSLARTSGGAPVLSVPDGYIFTDDPERSEDGAFTAALVIHTDIFYPIKPIFGGMGKRMRPMEVGLYVQLNLNGIAFQTARRGVTATR